MSMTEEEKTMLAEVAKDAAYRNGVRKIETNFMMGQVVGYVIAGAILLVLIIVGMVMSK
jgi:hypothetical protein